MSATTTCVSNGLSYEKRYTPPSHVGLILQKYDFISYCKSIGIDINSIWSKKLLPDIAVVNNKRLFIIEQKYQQVAGSVDEKLQTGPYKKFQYERLGFVVKFSFLCNEWFTQPCYRDLIDYLSENDIELL